MFRICLYAFLGGVIGGCLIPLVLFLFAAVVLRDTGGPLFWPLIAIPFGLIGLAVGAWSGSDNDVAS
jgi:hypothetical protein